MPDVADPVTALNAVRALVGAPPILAPPKEEASRVLASVLDVLRKHGNWGSDALAEIRRAVGAPERAPSPSDVYLVRAAACLAAPTTHMPPPAKAIQIRPVSHPDPNVLERSHLFPILNGLVLEGQFALHVFFWDNFHRLYEAQGRHSAVAFSFTPLIRVRILRAASDPLKTLSWMPKVDAQWVRAYRQDVPSLLPEHARTLTVYGTLGHHSNGQDECLYQPRLPEDDRVCPPPAARDLTVNYPNGNFSTNYIRLGAVHRWLTLVPFGGGRVARSSISLGLVGETNPRWLHIGGVLPEVIRPFYGANRIRLLAEHERRLGSVSPSAGGFWQGSLRFTGSLDYIDKQPGTGPLLSSGEGATPLEVLYRPAGGSSRWRAIIEAAWHPDWMRGWGVEARYYHGQDYYNIQFVRDIHWFQAGIVFDAGEFQLFQRPPPP
ncbi:MAG TPA: hypothetical protein VGL15_13115 [Vicinamibacteria bacterium]